MDPLTTTAASGMRAGMEALDMLANNIANSSTAGFKAGSEFYGVYHAQDSIQDPSAPAPVESPLIERQWTDFSQGQFTATGNDLDLALSGEGFFTVQTPSGPLYTRDGSFHISPQGTLETRDGYSVLDANNTPIKLDLTQPVNVDSSGAIAQSGATVGVFKLVKFTAPQALSREEHSYFRLSVADLQAVPATGVEVQQRRLEMANVQPAQAAVRLVSVMRQFEMLQRAMSIGNEMNKHAVEDVARVSD